MTRTGAQLLVECLLEQDVEMGFGVPGESYLAVLDALHDVTNRFRFIGCRNEAFFLLSLTNKKIKSLK